MAKREYFKNGSNFELPITGTFYTDEFAPDYDGGMIVIALYDASGDIVTAFAGECLVETSPIKGQWLNGVSYGDATILLATAGADATYNLPGFNGPQVQSRITLSGVVGADHVKAYIWRY